MLKTHLQILDHKIQAQVSFKVKRKNIWIIRVSAGFQYAKVKCPNS